MPVLLFAVLIAAPVVAQDSYLGLAWSEVVHESGAKVAHWSDLDPRYPIRVVLDGPGEAYVIGQEGDEQTSIGRPWGGLYLYLKIPKGRTASGKLFWVSKKGSGRGSFAVREGKLYSQIYFEEAKASVLSVALRKNQPGSAWFRSQLQGTQAGRAVITAAQRWNRAREDDPIALLTGGKAISENLQLDRNLATGASSSGDEAETVAVESLPGITVRALDWKKLLQGVNPPSDALAKCIPADQYAVFFPNFSTAHLSLGAVMSSGTPVLQGLTQRAEDDGILPHYTHQLGLHLERLATDLQNYSDVRVALTGSDSHWALGTDVALVFWTKRPKVLAPTLYAHRLRNLPPRSAPEYQVSEGEAFSVKIQGCTGPLRRVSSFIATLDNAVVFSNSRTQLEKIIRLKQGTAGSKSLGDLDEYKWFRHRYPRGAADESAFLFISDPAIRKWCSPRWRIGAARRLQAAAEITDLHARYHLELTDRLGESKAHVIEKCPITLGRTTFTRGTIHSERWNTQAFLTPVSELAIEKVTRREADAYRRWRRGYQSNWTNFDPVGMKLSLSENRMAIDITVMPLIIRSAYRGYVDFAKGGLISEASGDRHPGTALQFSITLNPDSEELKEIAEFLSSMGGLNANPLSWLGDSVTIYVDQDNEFFAQLASLNDQSEIYRFLEHDLHTLPAAFHCEVKSPLKLALFLTALRAWVEGAAPDLASWKTRTHNGKKYVRIGYKGFMGRTDSEKEEGALYYSASEHGLLFTFNEPLLKRHLNRIAARDSASATSSKLPPYLGKHLNGEVQLPLLQQLSQLRIADLGSSNPHHLCFANLPILNTWKKLYPNEDPVDIHERIFGTRLICPAGGTYAWSQEWQTMESTALGHPAEPVSGSIPLLDQWQKLRFGITFENDGLRARAELTK